MAYLGILLLFAGVTGFVVFAWGDVERNLRPVAEVAIPVTLFLTGWYLRRRGANVVGGTLVLGGGAVLPIVTVAALVDGAAVPPDVAHGGLVLAATLAVAALAAVYAVVGTRRPTSPLRYLAAPTLWLAVGIAALAPSSSELAGEAIARIGAAQFAAIAVALAATSILARLLPHHPLSRPTMIAAVGGIVVVAALALVTGAEEGWPWLAGLVTAGALAVALEGVAPLLPAEAVGALQAVSVGAGALALGGGIGPGWAAVVATGSFLALLGWQGARRPGPVAMGTAAGGVLVAAGVSLVEPWAAVVAFGLLTVAAHVARHRRASRMPAGVLTGVAAVAPLGIAVGLFGALSPGVAATVLGAAVVLEAIGVRLTEARRDPFFRTWIPCAAGVVAVTALVLAPAASAGWLAAASGLAAVAVALSALAAEVRLWAVCAAGAEAAAFALAAAGVSEPWRASALGAAGLLFVVGARRGWLPLAGHVGLVGHSASLIAIGAAVAAAGVHGGHVSAALVLATAGFAVTAVRQEREGAPAVATAVQAVAFDPGTAAGESARCLPSWP